MPLFDRIVMVDWSAAAVPTTGRDSIWIASAERGKLVGAPINVPTRSAAIERLKRFCEAGLRVLIGFDFAFGYSAGTAARFGRDGWRSVWSWLASRLRDGDDNGNDRFALAASFNERFPDADGPLWGHPRGVRMAGLSATRPPHMPEGIEVRRRVERIVRSAQPVWKLAYPGSVGSQALTGIARLERWRHAPTGGRPVVVWPFETGFADALTHPVVLAEIYPSLFPVEPEAGEVKDAAQVRTLAVGYSRLDAMDRLTEHLSGPSSHDARPVALREEGWIMSVTDRPLSLAA